ncbi:MAG: hypothetical protein AB7K71_01540 [Polyangiaceae bacterium]
MFARPVGHWLVHIGGAWGVGDGVAARLTLKRGGLTQKTDGYPDGLRRVWLSMVPLTMTLPTPQPVLTSPPPPLGVLTFATESA